MYNKLLVLFLIYNCQAFASSYQDTIEVSRKFKTILIFQDNIAESIIGSDIGFAIDLPRQIGSKFNSRILKIYYDDLAVEKENMTNLTVITETGNLFDFILKLSEQPKKLTWNINNNMADLNIENRKLPISVPSEVDSSGLVSESDIEKNGIFPKELSETLSDSTQALTTEKLYENDRKEYYRQRCFYMQFDKPKIPRYFARKDDVFLWLKGVYYNRDELYVQLRFENRENIDFDINFLKFFIVSTYKGSTKQKIPITKKSGLLYSYKVPQTVKGNTENHFVIVLKKITLDNKKELLIELDEDSGNRNLSLNIGKDIINKPISF